MASVRSFLGGAVCVDAERGGVFAEAEKEQAEVQDALERRSEAASHWPGAPGNGVWLSGWRTGAGRR